MGLIIEPICKSQIDEVAKIESELIKKIDASEIEKTIGSDKYFYFVLRDENEICGFLEGMLLPPESELFEIAIKTNFQGRGYSKLLLEFYLKFAKEKGCDTIFLEVNNINQKAINLYKKFGFFEYARRKNYYGENQDAILMKLEI